MGETVIALEGVVAIEDVHGLCASLLTLIRRERPAVVVCDVGDLVEPDVVAVEAVASLQLTARRAGSTVVLRHPSADLCALLHLAGLDDVVGVSDASSSPGGPTPG